LVDYPSFDALVPQPRATTVPPIRCRIFSSVKVLFWIVQKSAYHWGLISVSLTV
jgi:hypothetical protein